MESFVIAIQARVGSHRLPNKIFKQIGDRAAIKLLVDRLKLFFSEEEIVLAVPDTKQNQTLVEFGSLENIKVIQGDENDVFARYLKVGEVCDAQNMVRLTADCPFFDPRLLLEGLTIFMQSNLDYLSNVLSPSFADGMDWEIFSVDALKRSEKYIASMNDREHVTPAIIREQEFKKQNVQAPVDNSHIRLTLDNPEDLYVLRAVWSELLNKDNFSYEDLLKLYEARPELFSGNQNFQRNEGAKMNRSQKLWRRAKKSILGGNMLLSKHPDQYLPEQWPTYFDRAIGCQIWGLDGAEYIDFATMSIGTNLLGYARQEVNEAVLRTVNASSMSTLNAPEEVELAERLLGLHTWASKVKFARTGGEANAIALRIARSRVKNQAVAFCGYHGWHDWYLAANLKGNDTLGTHLLPELKTDGVPSWLVGTAHGFQFNDLNQLEYLLKDKQVGVIFMEVHRNIPPEEGFLASVRQIADDYGAILIFDECTSGFRETFGGLHLKYKVAPDITILSKALGNGFPIAAVLGNKDVMKAAEDSFISSTFWTDRIGPVAALATLQVMEELRSWEVVTHRGQNLQFELKKLIKKHHIKASVFGLPALTSMVFDYEEPNLYKSFVTKNMLDRGYLYAGTTYLSIAHSEKLMTDFLQALDACFSDLTSFDDIDKLKAQIKGPLCLSGFKRLN